MNGSPISAERFPARLAVYGYPKEKPERIAFATKISSLIIYVLTYEVKFFGKLGRREREDSGWMPFFCAPFHLRFGVFP